MKKIAIGLRNLWMKSKRILITEIILILPKAFRAARAVNMVLVVFQMFRIIEQFPSKNKRRVHQEIRQRFLFSVLLVNFFFWGGGEGEC